MTEFSSYADRFKHVRLERDDDGVLVLTIHKDGGAAKWGAYRGDLHDELGEAFYQIGRDPDTKVVVFTSAGDRFVTEFDSSNRDEAFGPKYWARIFKEGRDLIMNLLEIEVPVIGAVVGPAFIHAELITMSDIVIASETAVFADKAHMTHGAPPSDGAHVWWQMLLGPNRGRDFLLRGSEISALEAQRLGFVAEITPAAQTIPRACEIARELAQKPALSLRMSRVALTQHIKRRMHDDLGYGLMLEGVGLLDMYGPKPR